MVGRERDIAIVRDLLTRTVRKRVPGRVTVSGVSGIGKTVFLDNVARMAQAEDWFVVETACHEIQRNTSFIVANRLVSGAIRRLGTEADRYISGLAEGLAAFDAPIANLLGRDQSPSALNRDRYRETFLRFFEGVGIDYPMFFAIDDAQWMDPQSSDMIDALMSSGGEAPLVVASCRRVDATFSGPILRSDSTIRLHPLDFASTATLVRHLLTGADDAVVDTIARHSGGSPLEIATLCDEIARRAPGSPQRPLQHLISDGVAALKPAEREFLQICALLGEPIEYRILFKLYPDAEALGRLMGAAVTPYLLADGPALRFRHASVLEAVRETVDFDLPLRRKIIAALRQLESSEATDYERLVQQASACDDRELVFASHIRFADVAFGRKRWDAVVQASERALAAGEPEAADFVQFFSHYATALRSLERGGEASDVLREALRKAEFAGIKKGHGALIALLMAELWVEENVDEALAVCDRYLNLPMDPSDHAYILATALMICGIALDTPLFEKYDTLFHAVSPFAPNFAQATRGSAYASISSGRGDYDEAKRAMRRAIAVADQRGSRQSDDLPFMELCIDIRQYGCVVAEERLAKLLDQTRFESRDLVYGNLLSSWLSVARGNWFDARLSAEDAIATETTIGMRATAIGTLAMIGALSNDEQALPGDTMIVAERLLHEGYGESALLLFPWLLVRRKHPELEDFLVRHLRNARTQPRIHVIGYTPAALVLAGQNSENPALHDYVMQRETPVDKSPWSLAHWGLARGILLEREKPSAAAALLKAVSRDFTGLGASFFAAYAAMRAGAADSEQQSLLDRLNVTLSTQPTSVRPKKPKDDRFGLTPREWQVARLIADGSTNKEIAESLFLSERTVESHVSNTLAKLQLASRTLLTRWMYQNSAL